MGSHFDCDPDPQRLPAQRRAHEPGLMLVLLFMGSNSHNLVPQHFQKPVLVS